MEAHLVLKPIVFFRRLQLRHAIFSAAVIDARSGFMLHDMHEAELSRQAGRQASGGSSSPTVASSVARCPLLSKTPSYDMLVTDLAPPADVARMLERNQIELVVATQNASHT